MPVCGVEFAPIRVPLERRIQTLAAAAWIFTILGGAFIGILAALYILLFTRFWWILLLYLGWVWLIDNKTCERGSRRIEWVREWIWWEYFRDYFPLSLERLPGVQLDPKKNYLFCCFPHGMLSSGAFNAFSTNVGGFSDYFPHHVSFICTLAQHFAIPFFRELALSLGSCSASADSLNYILGKPEGGQVAVLMVGGAAEAYHCKPGLYKLVLNNRKGFIKIAYKNGSPLVPVISFGETDLYDQVGTGEESKLKQFQELLRKYIGIAPIIPIGRGFFQYSFGIIPRRHPVTTVVGKPIEVPKVEHPSSEQINQLHKTFVEELKNLFENQKKNYLKNHENIFLQIT